MKLYLLQMFCWPSLFWFSETRLLLIDAGCNKIDIDFIEPIENKEDSWQENNKGGTYAFK